MSTSRNGCAAGADLKVGHYIKRENGRSGDRPFLFLGVEVELLFAFVFGRGFFQSGQQHFCAGQHRYGVLEDDVFGADFFAVEIFVGAIVGAECGAFEGDAGKKATGAGVGENFGAHGDIGFR